MIQVGNNKGNLRGHEEQPSVTSRDTVDGVQQSWTRWMEVSKVEFHPRDDALTRQGNGTSRATSVPLATFLLILLDIVDFPVPVQAFVRALGNCDIDVFHHDDGSRGKQSHGFEQDGVIQSFGGQGDHVNFEVESARTGMLESGANVNISESLRLTIQSRPLTTQLVLPAPGAPYSK